MSAAGPLGAGRDRRRTAPAGYGRRRPGRTRSATLPNEDSPDRVDAAIAKFVEISKLDRASEENRRTYARMWMEQAQDLMQWGEFEQAEKLASLAGRAARDLRPLRRQAGRTSAADCRDAGDESSRLAPCPLTPTTPVPAPSGRHRPHGSRRSCSCETSALPWPPGSSPRQNSCAASWTPCGFPNGPSGRAKTHRAASTRPSTKRRAASRPAAYRQAGGTVDMAGGVNSAVYDPSHDRTRNVPGRRSGRRTAPRAAEPAGRTFAEPDATGQSPGYSLFQQGEAALKARDRDRALRLFRQAAAYSSQLDQVTAERLQDHISLLSAPQEPGTAQRRTGPAGRAAGRGHCRAEIAGQPGLHRHDPPRGRGQGDARERPQGRPRHVAGDAEEGRDVRASSRPRATAGCGKWIGPSTTRSSSSRRTARTSNWTRRTTTSKSELQREALTKEQTQQELAKLVDEFNRLSHEQRFEEARKVVAKKPVNLPRTSWSPKSWSKKANLRANIQSRDGYQGTQGAGRL